MLRETSALFTNEDGNHILGSSITRNTVLQTIVETTFMYIAPYQQELLFNCPFSFESINFVLPAQGDAVGATPF